MAEPTTTVEMFNLRWREARHEPFLVELPGRTMSYDEVKSAAEALGGELDRFELAPGSVVGLHMSNRIFWVVGSLAAWSRGLTVAAVNRLVPADSAAKALRLCDAQVVCAAAGDEPYHPDSIPTLPVTLQIEPAGSAEAELAEVEADGDAAIFFTSGTTGEPKAFLSTHRQLGAAAREQARSYANDPTFRVSVAPEGVAPIVSFTAFGHLAAYNSLAFALWTGRRLVLVEKFTVEAAKALVEQHRVTMLRLNPAAIHMIATADLDIDMANVRYVYSGTAPLSAKTRELFGQRYGIPILQGYGQSETGPIALSRYEDVVSGREPAGSVGRVLDQVEVRIADADDRPLENDREGEIQVRTDRAAAPVGGSTLPVTADGYVRTGDVGRMSGDGFLWITGRLTDKMVVGGFNVFPAEVEEALRHCELVRDVVVVGLPDDRLGERPAAGVVWNGEPAPETLELFARDHLAAYKVPRVWFGLDQVPQTDRGKVDRRAALSVAMSVVVEA